MTTVTLTSKGQLTIPRQLRDANRCEEDNVNDLAAGARLQTSIDSQGRLVLVPAKHEPEDLFRHRTAVQRSMSLADMDRAIAAAVDREDP